MSDDKLSDLMKFASGFDFFTPLHDIAMGYHSIEYEGMDSDCKAVERELQQQGIKCRVDFTGDGWRVIAKRD